MKHPKVVMVLAITVLAALVVGTVGCDAPGSAKVFRNTDNPVYVELNQEFIIALEANHTTGYSWQLAQSFNTDLLELVSNEYEAPESDLMGAPGEEKWTFKAIGEGRTVLSFTYVRPWEKGERTETETETETETSHSTGAQVGSTAQTTAAAVAEAKEEVLAEPEETVTFTVDVGPKGSTTDEPSRYTYKEGGLVDKDGKTVEAIEAHLGSEFALVLESNPTTGYKWQLAEPLEGTMLILVSQEYQQAKVEKGKEPEAGAGGEEVWTFRAVGEGEAEISLKYVRPWEEGSPTDETVTFTVNVKKGEEEKKE